MLEWSGIATGIAVVAAIVVAAAMGGKTDREDTLTRDCNDHPVIMDTSRLKAQQSTNPILPVAGNIINSGSEIANKSSEHKLVD